jgi:hypothetical protein
MTDQDDGDTVAAPTEQPAPPSTELPSTQHAETPEAGSQDDAAEDSASARNRSARARNLTLLVVIAVTIIVPQVVTLFESGFSKRAVPDAKPSMAVPVNAPPSAPIVARSTEPAVSSTSGFSAYDEKFLFLISQEGWGCTDNSVAEQCKKQMVNFAHEICSYSGQPVDLAYRNLGVPAFLGLKEERRAIANAELAYANCTLAGTP